ncbi:MAG: LPS assembly protein LptD [Pseudomonadota bacterium]
MKSVLVCCLAGIATSTPATAQFFGDTPTPQVTADDPAVITAEELIFDESRSLVIARGNVEISQGGRLLRADEVTYNQRTDIVTAMGNIVVREPTGELIFADYAELTGDLADGFVENISVRFSENARMIANTGFRRGGVETEAERAVYSPCRLCEENPERAPLWQLRAREVTHNAEDQNVYYRDAYLDIFGVPVFYTPYLYHPDPTVDRRSGFLVPRFGSTPALGQFGILRYYWDIAPNQDLTASLGITTEQNAFLRGEYRYRFQDAEIIVDASANYSNRREDQGDEGLVDIGEGFRGHIFADGLWAIDENWRAGFSIQEVTDNTYLDEFEISDADVLTSRVFAEGFYGLSYALVEAFEFTDLRTDTAEQPLVAPWGQFNYVGEPGAAPWGGQWLFNTSVLALTRDDVPADLDPDSLDGVDTYRFIVDGEWRREQILNNGLVTELEAGAAGELYWSDSLPDPNNPVDREFDSFAARLIPTVAATASYPMVRQAGRAQQLIEPIAQVRATGLIDNDGIVPNNDSPAPEFDETNLFSESRYAGYDEVDDGVRLTYGVRLGHYDPEGPSGTLFLGQSYRTAFQEEFPPGSGLESDFSDVVGQLSLQPFDGIDFDWRFRLDATNLSANRNEINLTASNDWISGSLQYAFVDAQAGTRTGDDVEEFFAATAVDITQYWTASAALRYDLQDSETREIRLGLRYLDECFSFGVDWRRQLTDDTDPESGDSIFLTIEFRHFAEEAVGFSGGSVF